MLAARRLGMGWGVLLLALGASGCSSLSLDGLFGGGDDEVDPSSTDALEGGSEGPPPTFVTALPPMSIAAAGAPTFLTSDGTSLFFATDHGDAYGSILRFTPDGSPPVVLAQRVYRPTGIAVDGGRVYFGAGGPVGGHTFVRSADKTTGGTVVDAFDTGWSDAAFTALAIQGASLAWASKADEEGAVYRGLADGTGASTVATKQGPVTAVAVAGAYTYWTRDTQLFRKRTGAATDAPPELVASRGLFTSLASDGLDVYATSDDGTLVATTATDEVPVSRVLGGTLLSPRSLAVDAWFVYTVSTGTRSVVAFHRKSGRMVEVIKGGDPYAVAVTAAGVWVADRNARTLAVVPKAPAEN